MSDAVRRLAAGVVLLAIASAGPALAQSPAALRAAMLYEAGLDAHAVSPNGAFGAPEDVLATSRAARRDTLPPDPWIGRDKVLHAAGSFLLTLSAQYVLTSKLDASEDGALPIAAGATLSLGLAKEIADSRRPVRPFFSTRDLVADAVGVALAVGLILL